MGEVLLKYLNPMVMMIYKCDSCGEIMDEKNKIRAGYKWDTFELCPSCGWEVVDFLQSKKLILLRQPHEF